MLKTACSIYLFVDISNHLYPSVTFSKNNYAFFSQNMDLATVFGFGHAAFTKDSSIASRKPQQHFPPSSTSHGGISTGPDGIGGFKKNYQCPHCNYSTIKRQHLEYHIRTHTGEKPHQCPHCPYRASHVSNVKRHVAFKHR